MSEFMLVCFVWGLLLTVVCGVGGWRGMAIVSAIMSVTCALMAIWGATI